MNNPVYHLQNKYIYITFNYVREIVAKDTFKILYIPANKMVTDIFTKAQT